MIGRTDFLGVGFDPLSLADAIAWLAARDAASAFGYVVTPNVDHMVRLADAPTEVRDAYAQAALCLCDSRVLAKLAALCGIGLPVAPGSDLTAAVFMGLLDPADRLCIVGGEPADIARLRQLYPAIAIDHIDAPMGLRHDAAARERVAREAVAVGARITLLAVGAPQQELVARTMALDPAARGTALCIGASVDFLVGRQVRAPRLIQRLSLEWAWRLASDPARLARRYLIDGPAIFPLVWRWRRERSR